MHKKILTLSLGCLLFSSIAFAQNNDSESLKQKKVYVSIFHPISSDGFNSKEYSYNLSMGLFSTKTGSTKGCSLSSLVNISNNSSSGISMAGISNLSKGNYHGVQMSSVLNFNTEDFKGIQSSGMINLNTGRFNGVQMSSVLNTNSDTFFGIQLSGMINITKQATYGIQMACIFNHTSSDFKGFQFAGVFNNVVKKMSGFQMGLINKANTLDGVQFGLINVCDTVESGVSIGLINHTKNGLKELNASFGETFNTSVSFKMGQNKFYSIVSIGAQYYQDDKYFGAGLGFGTQVSQKTKLPLFLDLTCYNVYKHFKDGQINLLNKLELSYHKEIASNTDLTFGIIMYGMLSYYRNSTAENSGTNLSPFHIAKYARSNYDAKIWPGLSIGFSFM